MVSHNQTLPHIETAIISKMKGGIQVKIEQNGSKH